MRKVVGLISVVIMIVSLLILNLSCEKANENDDPKKEEPSENPNTPGDNTGDPESEYVFFDNKKELGNWDAAIFGKEGFEYYYKFEENRPKEFVIWDINKDSVSILAHFDERGFPSYLITGDYALVFDNFGGQYFDLVVLLKDEIVFKEDSVLSDLNWDELYSKNIGTKAGTYSAMDDARRANAVLASIGCTCSALTAVATGGLAIPLSVISCTGALVTIVEASCNGCVPTWLLNLASVAGSTDAIGLTLHTIGTFITNSAEVIDNNYAIEKAQALLSIQVNANASQVSAKSAVIMLPLKHHLKPGYSDGMSIDIGIFYSEDPNLPIENRKRVSDEKLNWMTLYNGGKIEGRVELSNLKPNTTYYYMPYINMNLDLTYGKVGKFKTQPDSLFIVGTWEGPASSVPSLGLVFKNVYTFYPNGTFTADLNADRVHYVQDFGGHFTISEDQLQYILISGMYYYDQENNYIQMITTSYIAYDIVKTIIEEDGSIREEVRKRETPFPDRVGIDTGSGTVFKISDSEFIIRHYSGVGHGYKRMY